MQISVLGTYLVPKRKNDTQYFDVEKHYTTVQRLIDIVTDGSRLLILEEERLERPKDKGIALF